METGTLGIALVLTWTLGGGAAPPDAPRSGAGASPPPGAGPGVVEGAVPADAARPARIAGRVLDAAGAPVPRALVTAHTGGGVSVTVYADGEGRYSLPDLPWPVEAVEARSARLGTVRRSAGGDGRWDAGGASLDLSLEDASEPPVPTGADWLSLLPDGETKRRFVLDCSGCHVWNEAWVRSGGERRTRASWEAAIGRMKDMFGPGSGFPVVSSWPEPAALGAWLDRGFGATIPTPASPPTAVTVGAEGAVLTEYALPEPGDLPHDLAVDREGRVVVTGMFTHRMYVLDPATGAFETRPIPVETANPRAVTLDDEGRWWVLLGQPGRVARHDPRTGRWDSWDIGTYPHSIDLDAAGRVWFNGHFTVAPELLGSLAPGTGTVTPYEVPPAAGAGDGDSTIPYGLRVDGEGRVWGTQLRGNGLVRLDPGTGEVRRWEMPWPHSGPRRLDVDSDGSVWIPEYAAGRLARFDPASESFTEWEIPLPDALPYVVRVDRRRGGVWIGTGHGDAVVHFDPGAETFTVYPLATRGALVRHLHIDEERGEVWAAYGASPGIPARILRIRP